jgi:hypothetical protein
MWRNLSLALVLGLAGMACRDSGMGIDPKNRLSEYINYSFSVKGAGDRQRMLDFLTGDAKSRLEAWSDDQFLEAFTATKRQFLKLSFREVKPLNPEQVNITYEVTYLDQAKGHNAKVTTKKLCELSQQEGKWFISDVHNIKELVEYQDDITISPVH